MENLKGFKSSKGINGGVQHLFRFDNNYGASVVKHDFSYGGSKGLWELAVIIFKENEDWNICYSTKITNDVLGWLSDEDVKNTLKQIEKL